MLQILGSREKNNDNVINNKGSAEHISKPSINFNEKLQIRVMWSQLNTTEEWLEKQKEKQNEYQNDKDDTAVTLFVLRKVSSLGNFHLSKMVYHSLIESQII